MRWGFIILALVVGAVLFVRWRKHKKGCGCGCGANLPETEAPLYGQQYGNDEDGNPLYVTTYP